MPVTHLRTTEFTVHEEADVVFIERRFGVMYWLGAGMALLAGLAGAATPAADRYGWALSGDERLALQVLLWVAGLGALLTVSITARRQHRARPTCFDFARGVLRIDAQNIPLNALSRVVLTPQPIGETVLLGISVEVGGSTLPVIPPLRPRHGEALRDLVERLQARLAEVGHAVNADYLPRPDQIVDFGRMLPIVFITLGGLWALLGYLFARRWLLELDEHNGLLIWPLGLWLLAIGLAEAVGVRILQAMTEGRWYLRAAVLILPALIYLLLCLRPLT